MEIEGVAAVVTGGASGLGGAAARRLAELGARVVILDRDAAAGEAAARAIGGLSVQVDIANEAALEGALDQAGAAHGPARIVANCAGVAPAKTMIDREGAPMALADFSRAVSINLIGTFAVMSRAAARMIPTAPVGEERGVIINVASIAAFEGQVEQTAYAASKAGVVGLTLPAARELAQHMIRVVTIAPGLFETPMLQGLPPATQSALDAQVPHPARLGRPAEFAEMVAAVVRNPMLNESMVRLDDGLRMPPR